MERAVRYLVKRHRQADAADEDALVRAARRKQIKTLKASIVKVKGFLATHDDKLGAGGRIKKISATDNASAKMRTGKGVIQGYDGLAAVDAKRQVIVHARAYGEAQEHGPFIPALEGTRQSFQALGDRRDVFKRAAISADSGFHSEANVRFTFENGIDAYVADTLILKRDPRFATAARHVPQRAAEPWGAFYGAWSVPPRTLQRCTRAYRTASVCGQAAVSQQPLRRFSLSGESNVNTQWLLYCIVHNLGKSAPLLS